MLKKNQNNTNQTKSVKISLPFHPPKIPQISSKNNETKAKTLGERREKVIACDKRKITKAQLICAFSKTELNIYDGINAL